MQIGNGNICRFCQRAHTQCECLSVARTQQALEARANQLTYELDKSRDSHVKRTSTLEAENGRLRKVVEAARKYADMRFDTDLASALRELDGGKVADKN